MPVLPLWTCKHIDLYIGQWVNGHFRRLAHRLLYAFDGNGWRKTCRTCDHLVIVWQYMYPQYERKMYFIAASGNQLCEAHKRRGAVSKKLADTQEMWDRHRPSCRFGPNSIPSLQKITSKQLPCIHITFINNYVIWRLVSNQNSYTRLRERELELNRKELEPRQWFNRLYRKRTGTRPGHEAQNQDGV